MKKFIYLLMLMGFVFTACEPMEDIHTAADAVAAEEIITGEIIYTLADLDYTAEEDDGGFLELDDPKFGSIDVAKNLIPNYLTGTYPIWGDGSLATVTFKYYNPKSSPSGNIYELSEDEINAITGKTYGTFDRDYHIFDYLEATYPSPSEGDFYSLRYDFYAGSVTTKTDGFYFENDEWTKITGFTEDEYKSMGNSFPNFGSHDDAALKIPLILPDIYKFSPKVAGDIVQAMYELYKGGGVTKSYVNNYVFNGSTWDAYDGVANETIKFGHDGNSWVPDNTIKYTLVSADYDFLGTEYGFPGYYNNFGVRSGDPEETEAVRLAHINAILLNNFPGKPEGQKFIVVFKVYSGVDEFWQMKVILSGGVYILQTE